MIKKLHVQNFRQFADLNLELPQTTLLMGNNGSGKTSVFDVLWGIRQMVVENANCQDAFPLFTFTRWANVEGGRAAQTFVMTIDGPYGEVCYGLTIGQDFNGKRSSVIYERLADPDGILFSFEGGKVQLYEGYVPSGPGFPFDDSRSPLAAFGSPEQSPKLHYFKTLMTGVTCIGMDARRLSANSEREQLFPDREFSNFASWYRSAIQRDAASVGPFLSELKEAMYGFRSLNLQALGQGFSFLQAKMSRTETHSHHVVLRPERSESEYPVAFSELSDGQRALIALYAILHFLVTEGAVICLDEPDNYLALEEIQPFILRLLDEVEAKNAQVIIASHHPEIYNTLARDQGLKTTREPDGSVVAARYEPPEDSKLPISELIARGELS